MSAESPLRHYPGRPELINGMLAVLKAARRPLMGERAPSGLDFDGWHHLDLLTDRLARHQHFEYLERKEIRSALHQAVLRYRRERREKLASAKNFAADVLDALAREPMHRTVYLGVHDLRFPNNTVVGNVRFLDLSDDPELADAFAQYGRSGPDLVCEVEVRAGTDVLLRERARDAAETALALLRQHNLFGFASKTYLEQVMYGLDGRYALRDGSTIVRAGWWRHRPTPVLMDLAHPNLSEWRAKLAELSHHYSALSSELRQRVDTCIDWLNVAALTDRWRVIIPAIFSGMEALLVPETFGLKAEVVTVRSVGVHVALGHGFFDPATIMAAYHLRSDLIHGKPTRHVLDRDVTSFVESRRFWAYLVLCDYLQLADELRASTVREMVSYVDDKSREVCTWLTENGGSAVVAEYEKIVRPSSGT